MSSMNHSLCSLHKLWGVVNYHCHNIVYSLSNTCIHKQYILYIQCV